MKTPARRRGYSLVELVVCMPLTAMLLLGMASAIHIASQTTSSASHGPGQTATATQALDYLVTEIRYATTLTTGTATEIICSVPDRNGNGAAETIRFYWSGAVGSPLYRQVNGSALEVVVASADSFAVTYNTYVDAATSKTHVRGVDVSLVLPSSAAPVRVMTSCRLLNEPVSGA